MLLQEVIAHRQLTKTDYFPVRVGALSGHIANQLSDCFGLPYYRPALMSDAFDLCVSL
jgi:hypothetical protein